MPVLADIQIKINALEVVLALHCGRKAPPKLVEQTQTAIEQAQTLLQPQTVYKWVPVLSISGKEVILAPASLDHNAPITIGPYSYLMADAELALISAVTIGAQMDEPICVHVVLNGDGRETVQQSLHEKSSCLSQSNRHSGRSRR